MTTNILLKVTGLKVSYGGIQAVKGVDFEVHEGELVSLIGSNGAGNPWPRPLGSGQAGAGHGARRSWRVYPHDHH